jgi:hypothetical protein
MAEGASIVVLSSHMTGDGDRSYPQFVFTASDEPCAQGVSLNRAEWDGPDQVTLG